MLDEKYQRQIKEIVSKNLPQGTRVFVFGSSVREDNFHDVDLGVIGGKIDDKTINQIKDQLEESNLPYLFDVINFNQAETKFRAKILKGDILWLT